VKSPARFRRPGRAPDRRPRRSPTTSRSTRSGCSVTIRRSRTRSSARAAANWRLRRPPPTGASVDRPPTAARARPSSQIAPVGYAR